jgi:hypothetical protein
MFARLWASSVQDLPSVPDLASRGLLGFVMALAVVGEPS